MKAVASPIHGDVSSSLEDGASPYRVIDGPKRISNRRKILFACRAAFIGSIGGLLLGYDLGVISGALPLIADEFGMSIYQKELVTSLMIFGCVIGACIGGFICDSIGRKRTVYLVCLIFLIGSVMMTLSRTLATLYIGRVVIGIGASISAIVDISYLSEISPPEYRGAVVSTNELMVTSGILLAFLIDFSFMEVVGGWRYMFAFPVFLVAFWASLMSTMPESPRWLLVKGRKEEAVRVFRITCGGSQSDADKAFQHADASILAARSAESVGLVSIICKQWRLSMVVSISLMLLQQFSGHAPLIAYAPELFSRAGLAVRSGSVATIIVGAIKVVFTLISLSIVDRVGRRSLLLVGSFGMALSLLALSTAFDQRNRNDPLTSTQTSVALVSVCCAVASYSLGFGPVTWLVVSELFPDEIRGRALGIATVANWTANAIVVASYLSVAEAVGEQSTFIMYMIVASAAVLLIYAYVPETHLMEMPQIRRELTQRFEQVPLSDCFGPTRPCRRSTHDRVPLAVHLNYDDPRIVTNILQTKKDEMINPGFDSVSGDSGDFSKDHEVVVVHL